MAIEAYSHSQLTGVTDGSTDNLKLTKNPRLGDTWVHWGQVIDLAMGHHVVGTKQAMVDLIDLVCDSRQDCSLDMWIGQD